MIKRNRGFCVKYYFILVLVVLISACTREKKIRYLDGDLVKIFQLAKKQHKRVFVLITDRNCGSCKKFIDRLDEQPEVKKILERDYICYKADISNSKEHEIAEIVKCPSYPFPYFFDDKGKLLAFGFPKTKEYDISTLNNISIYEYRFKELFNLPVSSTTYKHLVSMNMQATLLLNEKGNASVEAANKLFKNSLHIAPYPYNMRYANLLSIQLNKEVDHFTKMLTYTPTVSDTFLYGDIENYVSNQHNSLTVRSIKAIEDIPDYAFDTENKQLGNIRTGVKHAFSFTIRNLSKIPLIIENVNHPCDCVKLSWTGSAIGYNEVAIIKGTFSPYVSGEFIKDIFVHTNSAKYPMHVVKIRGISN